MMTEREKFEAMRQADVTSGVIDIKLCPSVDFKGDANALVQQYNQFDAAAQSGVFVDNYSEDLNRRTVAEILHNS